jgi:DNA-binding HxlR family transcriptional regulator
MRSYRQYCSVAKALDVVGDRWNLLIVRELLLRGPSRYTDLLNGLPGIATNLLADRLRELEKAQIVSREEAPPPIATTLVRLTPRGEQLEGVLVELGRWGAPLMAEPAEHDAYRAHWLALPVQLYLRDHTPDRPPIAIELRAGEERITLETIDGSVRTCPGPASDPDLILTGTPQLVVGLVTGRLDLATARARGLECQGDAGVLRRLRPDAPQPPDPGPTRPDRAQDVRGQLSPREPVAGP